MYSEPAIVLSDISKCYNIYEKPRDRLLQMLARGRKQYYKEFWAVKNASFVVQRGETVGIIGRNGSGKSTLLQMICGTLNPTSGELKTQGRIAALLELGSGFNPDFTGRENVFLNAAILGLTNSEIQGRFAAIETFADIGAFIDQPVKMYSSGMLVRLAFAVIAHVDADILVIDEALSVGDAFFTQKCTRFLRDFMKNGTVLFVSHDTSAVKNLCSRAVWIDKGTIVESGSPKSVCEHYLQAIYEAQQGKSSIPHPQKKALPDPGHESFKDQRAAFLNQSNLRNDLEVFRFDQNAAAFGKYGATILNVELTDAAGAPLSWIVGGEKVGIVITAEASVMLEAPIVGFSVKDRLGQVLFGDNTYLTYQDQPKGYAPESVMQATFIFNMPILPPGDYTIGVAIADGTQRSHVQHHWIDNAVFFKSVSSSVATGLVGIPMESITLD